MGIRHLLHGVINGTRAFLPHLKNRPEAAIINTSSIFGLLSVPNQSIYHVGKYGVRGFTESLALEMKMEKSNVEVYSVHPGHIGTNIANIGAKNGKFEFDPEKQEDGPNIFGNKAKTVEEAGQLLKIKHQLMQTLQQNYFKKYQKKNKRIFVGSDAYAYDLIQRIFPKWYIYLLPFVFLIRRLFPKDKPLTGN